MNEVADVEKFSLDPRASVFIYRDFETVIKADILYNCNYNNR